MKIRESLKKLKNKLFPPKGKIKIVGFETLDPEEFPLGTEISLLLIVKNTGNSQTNINHVYAEYKRKVLEPHFESDGVNGRPLKVKSGEEKTLTFKTIHFEKQIKKVTIHLFHTYGHTQKKLTLVKTYVI